MAAMQHGSKVNNKLNFNMAAMHAMHAMHAMAAKLTINNDHIMAWALFSPGDAN